VKTSRDIVSSLAGSSFRRVTLDGQTWYLREIRTTTRLARGRPRTRKVLGLVAVETVNRSSKPQA
jgi:hypothetical protein